MISSILVVTHALETGMQEMGERESNGSVKKRWSKDVLISM